jgi:hypothetical protein
VLKKNFIGKSKRIDIFKQNSLPAAAAAAAHPPAFFFN